MCNSLSRTHLFEDSAVLNQATMVSNRQAIMATLLGRQSIQKEGISHPNGLPWNVPCALMVPMEIEMECSYQIFYPLTGFSTHASPDSQKEELKTSRAKSWSLQKTLLGQLDSNLKR